MTRHPSDRPVKAAIQGSLRMRAAYRTVPCARARAHPPALCSDASARGAREQPAGAQVKHESFTDINIIHILVVGEDYRSSMTNARQPGIARGNKWSIDSLAAARSSGMQRGVVQAVSVVGRRQWQA